MSALYYITYIVCRLHITATLVVILREVNYKEYVKKHQELMQM